MVPPHQRQTRRTARREVLRSQQASNLCLVKDKLLAARLIACHLALLVRLHQAIEHLVEHVGVEHRDREDVAKKVQGIHAAASLGTWQ